MGLGDIGASLPPGFRFYPSDEELVCYYLYKKITNEEEALKGTLVEIDLHTCEPWQLPEVAKVNGKEWYFFSFRDRKYGRGERANRATIHGYWKATGKDRIVINPNLGGEVMGMRKTLVFYRNRAPYGIKTSWIMHEFRIQNPRFPPKEDWVLCKVFHKSRCNNETTMDITEINRVSKTVPLASASSSLCSPSSYIQFTPAVDTNKLPWKNNIISNNVEEVGGGFKLNGVDHREYSTIQQMKFEIEDSIQNDFIPFDYFTA